MIDRAKNALKNNIKLLKVKGSFYQNFVFTLSGNAIAIGLGLLFTPFIARVYSPEAYGTFAFFMAFSQNLANVATLQFTRAYVLPKGEREFFSLVKLTMLSSLFFSVLSLLTFLIYGSQILSFFNVQALGDWLFLVPLSIIFLSINDIFNSWNIRIKEFGRGAVTKVFSTLTARTVTLIYGIVTQGTVHGMVIGDFASKPIDSFFALNKDNQKKIPLLFKNYNIKYLIVVIKKYKSYPLYVLPGNWLNGFSNQVPIFLLISSFDSSITGNYTLANSLLNIPGALLSAAIAPVFLQKASETFKHDSKDLPDLVLKLYNRIFYLGVIPFSIFIVFGDYIFTFFLGREWILAGEFARYMGVYFSFWMVSSALSSLYRIYQKEKLNLYVTILSFCVKVLGLLIGIYYKNFMLSIFLFSVGNLIGYMIQCVLLLRLVNLPSYKIVFQSFILMALIISVMMGLKIVLQSLV